MLSYSTVVDQFKTTMHGFPGPLLCWVINESNFEEDSRPSVCRASASAALRSHIVMAFNPWGPNEPAATVLAEEAWLQGAMLAMIFYGVVLVLSCQCFFLLLEQTDRSNYRAKTPFLVVVFMIFMLNTFHTGFNTKDIQLRFVENRNFPGGPSAFESYTTHDSLGSVAYVLMQWLCDALLVSVIVFVKLLDRPY